MAKTTLTTDNVVREFTAAMRPHLHHQQTWRQDAGGIRCGECDRLIVSPRAYAGAGLLPPAQRERAREAIVRWIRNNSPDSARLIFKV